ncbi:MAG TPA: Vms1/Ankzf1 family peptidyl-tRNA hydrolase [Burkholderiales bacterium]|nr:Vms1/Ankzf1 family peptidyl-tRNA hydrolase [Burkholderiales bacterium]
MLAALEPSPFPVLSLYLRLAPNQNGREDYHQFLRKVFSERAKALPEQSSDRESFDKDVTRIQAHLENKDGITGQALAIFASSGSDLFESIALEAPIGEHSLFISSVPHLYPLARLIENYPRYAAVILDTNKARIFVFGAAAEREEKIVGEKTRRTSKGGWSQARYQRRADNFHMHHIKEVVDTLDKIVREEEIQHVVVAGADVAMPILREHLPKELADKIVEIDPHEDGEDGSFVARTVAALREKDAETDVEKVQELMDAWRSGGLGVAGPEATLSAFQLGQVDELIITGSPETLKSVQALPEDAAPGDVQVSTSNPTGSTDEARLKLSDELVTRAQQTAARIRFIEDAALLADLGGVGALLRFRI